MRQVQNLQLLCRLCQGITELLLCGFSHRSTAAMRMPIAVVMQPPCMLPNSCCPCSSLLNKFALAVQHMATTVHIIIQQAAQCPVFMDGQG